MAASPPKLEDESGANLTSEVARRLEEFSRDLRERTVKIDELIKRLERVGDTMRHQDAASVADVLSRIERVAEGLRDRDARLTKDITAAVRRHEKMVDRAWRLAAGQRWTTGGIDELFDIIIRDRLKPVRQPLVLISQVPRSGGTLLNRLFDGHPEVLTHVYELQLGPHKETWPTFDLNDSPEQWFEQLAEPHLVRNQLKTYVSRPFLFSPTLQRRLFLHRVEQKPASTRAILDAYWTSYFNAWLDNHNLHGDKKIVNAFVPRLASHDESVDRFFHDYPDGTLIMIVRAPDSWYVSARAYRPDEYGTIAGAMPQWIESADAAVRAKRKYGDRACVVKFEDLVLRTEATMRHLAGLVGIGWDASLLTPTFNMRPVEANSALAQKGGAVDSGSASRGAGRLSDPERQEIQSLTRQVYDRVLNAATTVP
jgi:hypothetical protein